MGSLAAGLAKLALASPAEIDTSFSSRRSNISHLGGNMMGISSLWVTA
jgi:hypothetical protein